MAPETATEHPHIVQTEGVEGGRPRVRGTGLTVELLARFYKMGVSCDELLLMYPQLMPAALYDALSYYHDHHPEIERAISQESDLDQVKLKYGFEIGDKGRVIFTGPRGASQSLS